MSLWTKEYAPQSRSEFVGGIPVAFTEWMQNWGKFRQPTAVILVGHPGIGKTTMVHIVAKECGYQVDEWNGRNEIGRVRTIFGQKKRLLLIEETQSPLKEWGEGITKRKTVPLVFTCNDLQELSSIKAKCLVVKCPRPPYHLIMHRFKSLCPRGYSMEAFQSMIQASGNDIRHVLNTLQFSSKVTTGKDESLRLGFFDAARIVFGKDMTMEKRVNAFYTNPSLLSQLAMENYPGCHSTEIEMDESGIDIMKALSFSADAACDVDCIGKRLYQQQEWKLMGAFVYGNLRIHHVESSTRIPLVYFPTTTTTRFTSMSDYKHYK